MVDSNPKRTRHRKKLNTFYKDIKFEDEINLDLNKIPAKKPRYTKPILSSTVLKKVPKATSLVTEATAAAATTTATTTTTNIQYPVIHVDEAVSGELVLDTSVQDQLQLYAFALISNNGFVYFDQQLTACALLDWNNNLKVLKNDHPILIYKLSGFGFVCTCNPDRHDFINRVSSCISSDVDNLYDQCLHIKALESISDSFLKYHGIEEAETLASVRYKDHDYMKGNMDFVEQKVAGVQKLQWALKDTFLVNVPELDVPYAIIGTMYGKIQCLSCRTSCLHVHRIEAWSSNINLLESDDGMDLFQLLESVSKGCSLRNKPYSLKCHSTAPIQYQLSPYRKEVLVKDPSSFFIEEDGILQAIPVSTSIKCSCGGDIEEDLLAFKEQSVLLTRYRVIPIQCYFRTCIACNKLHAFDGNGECLINMGKFLIK